MLTAAHHEFGRFLIAGLLNTAFGYGVYALLVLLKIDPGLSLAIATLAGVFFNYFTTGRWVFGSSGLGQLPRFALVYGLTFAVNLWSLNFLLGKGVMPIMAQAMLLPVMVIVSFGLNKLFVFRA